MKLNLVGDTFTHLGGGNKGYSVHGRIANHVEWTKSDPTAEGIVFVDDAIQTPEGIASPKYAWIYESKEIRPNPTKRFLNNTQQWLDYFDMIFVHDQSLMGIDDKVKFVPANGTWITHPDVYEKTKMVSMISSSKNLTSGHSVRLGWIEKLRDRLDLYGRGFTPVHRKEEGLCDYMYSVAIENGIYSSYFTEKILDCFATGTIPIYLGAPDIGNFFLEDGIVFLDENFNIDNLNEDFYMDRLDIIKENLRRTVLMGMPEDYIYTNYLKG
jgi:hypothetical protein